MPDRERKRRLQACKWEVGGWGGAAATLGRDSRRDKASLSGGRGRGRKETGPFMACCHGGLAAEAQHKRLKTLKAAELQGNKQGEKTRMGRGKAI